MEVRQLGIRVLYTLNGNSQYYLAVPSRKVPVTILPSPASASRPSYGRAPFRACLEGILNSSPEVTPNAQQDFSVYVLDPLESGPAPPPPPQPAASRAPAAPGLALGLGLMSWALDDPACATMVTGTLFDDPVRGESLEVILALKQTPTVPRRPVQTWGPPHASTSTAAAIPAPAVKGNAKAAAPSAGTKRKSSIHRSYSTPAGPSSRPSPSPFPSASTSSAAPVPTAVSATRSGSRIGTPSLHPRSRTSSTSAATRVLPASPAPSPAAGTRPTSTPAPTPTATATPSAPSRTASTPTSRAPTATSARTSHTSAPLPHPSPNPTAHTSHTPHTNGSNGPNAAATADAVRQLLASATQADRSPELFALLGALGGASAEAGGGGGGGPVIGRAVVEALTRLLYPGVPAPAPVPAGREAGAKARIPAARTSSSSKSGERTHISQLRAPPSPEKGASDDEIVVLDKENVDPAAFRRRGAEKGKGKDGERASSPAPEPATPVPSNVLVSNTNSPTKRASGTDTSSNSASRKRRLDEVMDERDRHHERERTRKRTASLQGAHGRRASHTQSPAQAQAQLQAHLQAQLQAQLQTQLQAESQAHSRSQARRHPSAIPAAPMSDPGVEAAARGWATSTFVPAPASASASSPPRPSSSTLLSSPAPSASSHTSTAPRKPYVLPDWARTDTAMTPRLPEGREALVAERAAAEAQEAQEGRRARRREGKRSPGKTRRRDRERERERERERMKAKTPTDENMPQPQAQAREKGKEREREREKTSASAHGLMLPPPSVPSHSHSRPRTITRTPSFSSDAPPSSDAAYPIVAHPSSDNIFDLSPPSSPSPSPMRVPRTPTKRRARDDDGSPLFTPQSKSKSKSMRGSKKKTPRGRAGFGEAGRRRLPSLYASAALFESVRAPEAEESPVRAPPSPSPSRPRLGLAAAAVELMPSSDADEVSSPLELPSGCGGEVSSDACEPLEDAPRRLLPHWAVDLPPSSPFPPSSPVLSACGDGDGEESAPPATDFDFLPPSSLSPPSDDDAPTPALSVPGTQKGDDDEAGAGAEAHAHAHAYSRSEEPPPGDPQSPHATDASLTLEELSSMFMSDDFASAGGPSSCASAGADVSDFFPAAHATSFGESTADAEGAPLEDMNLEEVWASLKGLLEQNAVALPPGPGDAVDPSVLTRAPGAALSIDTLQLAQDVQDLFGGCVV